MDISIYFTALYFFVYGFFGWCTEVAFAACKERRFINRGFLSGPICPIYGFGVCAVIVFLTPWKSNLILLYIASVLLVTLLEGLTGWALDKIIHNKWWDYSEMPLNIGGYVCLLFSLIWGVACVLIVNLIHPSIHAFLDFLPVPLGIAIIVILGVLLIVDTCVTASAIFKFNKRLENMERIAAELHDLSEQLGENIYEKTIRAVETADEIQDKTEDALAELREKQQDISEDIREHIADLKARYSELDRKSDRIATRLLHAFPKLESRNYKERLREKQEELKNRLKK